MRSRLSHALKLLGTLSTSGINDGDDLDLGDLMPEAGFVFTGLLFEVSTPATTNSLAPATGSYAEALGHLAEGLARVTLYSKANPSQRWLSEQSGQRLAAWLQLANQQKHENTVEGTAYAGGGAAVTLFARLLFPFRHDGQPMGRSQFRDLKLEIREAASAVISAGNAILTRAAGNQMVAVYAMGYASESNPVISPISMREKSAASDVLGFDGVALPFALAHISADHDTTGAALTNGFDLTIGGRKLFDRQSLARVREQYEGCNPRDFAVNGGNALDTVANGGTGLAFLYAADPNSPDGDLPHGDVLFRQYGAQIVPSLLLFGYLPNDRDQVDACAASEVKESQRPVLASVNTAGYLGRHSRGSVSSAPVDLIPANESDFTERHGILFRTDGTNETVLSPAKVARAAAAVAAAPNDGSRAAAATKAAKLHAYEIPGAILTSGKAAPTDARAACRRAFSAIK